MYQARWDVIALDKLWSGCHLRMNENPRNRLLSRASYDWLRSWREKYATLMRLQDEFLPKGGGGNKIKYVQMS